jgi:hypothetical protein
VSITVTTDIFCDGDDCSQWTHGAVSRRTAASAARKNARRAGWKITRKGDFCPECVKGSGPK